MMSKVNHINVDNIEEDIKIVKELLKGAKDYRQYNGNKYFYSIEKILNDYTRQKQINEEHQKINGELREKVKELEEERQLVGMLVKNKRDGRIGIVLHQWENGSIAVLESINPRVINTHDTWNTLEIIIDEVKQVQTNNDSIPKQVIKDYLKEEKERFEVYKKESETNENLKLGMYKHLGAKNMCEKILGIEKIVTLD